MESAYIQTPLGIALLEGDRQGVSQIRVINQQLPVSKKIPEVLQQPVSELQEYFQGVRTRFTFTINPGGTAFQISVWKALMNIPFGRTISYLELSRILGDEKAIRAVAAANGKNPVWIAVPCHRVIGSNGSLTGYAGGLWRKKWLLEHENPPTQQSLF